jgi:hypothetical protein
MEETTLETKFTGSTTLQIKLQQNGIPIHTHYKMWYRFLLTTTTAAKHKPDVTTTFRLRVQSM